MAKIATQLITKAKSDDAEKLTAMDGFRDGKKWAAKSNFFDVLRFINAVEWFPPYSKPRKLTKCPLHDLRETLKSKGEWYSCGFIRGVQDAFQAEYSAYVFHRHQEGIVDGRTWASKANSKQLFRMKSFARCETGRYIFVLPYTEECHRPKDWSISLVANLYAVWGLGCDNIEYQEFWQPFVDEPIEKVIARFKLFGHRAGHKLQDRHYIAGFVDGALGLSERIEERMIWRTPISPPDDGSISAR